MVATDDVIPYMRRVQAVERELRELGLLWQMIESAAAISCPHDVQTILPTLVQTRERFDELQRRVVQALAEENLAQLQDELAAKAQCTIDILVRNLFERTADVGFLATDNVIREFCAAAQDDRAALRDPLRTRLREYCAKYSVYDDIIILDTEARLLVRLDDAAGPAKSADSIVQAALAAPSYVERFAPSDLSGATRPTLLYANRIENGHGAVVGVLVLRFRFEDEMQRIFASIADSQQQFALVLVDRDNRVIASNDPSHVPLDITIRAPSAGGVDLVAFAGREYLATACASQGYQGYHGPGWRAQALVSLLTAFHSRAADRGTSDLALDNGDLKALQFEADAINRNLRRVVWNGRLMAGNGDTARLKAVLSQVTQAGARTSERVRGAVGDLHSTSLDRACRQTAEIARLAADIMDRNLYERANDCRWWALSPVLRRVLASPETPESAREIGGVLDTINGLYTVYRRLVAFDAKGTIRAASNETPGCALVGSAIDSTLLEATRALSGSQHYAVSPYAPSVLSEGEPTYIYLAAVYAEGGAFAGGIGVVFHAVREFSAMLHDVMGGRTGFAAFVDETGTVVACNSAQFKPGDRLPVDGSIDIANVGKEQFAVARGTAGGYREFKTSDGYDNRIGVLVALRLGSTERRHSERMPELAPSVAASDRSRAMEVAIIQVASARYALPADRVLLACAPSRIVQAPNAKPHVLGLMQVDVAGARTVVPVISARRLFGVQYPPRASDGIAIVLRHAQEDRPSIALWVDDVVSVQEIARDALQETPEGIRSEAQLVTAVFDQGDASSLTLVQFIDADRLEGLGRQHMAATAPPAAPATVTGTAAAAPRHRTFA